MCMRRCCRSLKPSPKAIHPHGISVIISHQPILYLSVIKGVESLCLVFVCKCVESIDRKKICRSLFYFSNLLTSVIIKSLVPFHTHLLAIPVSFGSIQASTELKKLYSYISFIRTYLEFQSNFYRLPLIVSHLAGTAQPVFLSRIICT